MQNFGFSNATMLIKRCFQLTCFILAVIFIFKQIFDYLRNGDVTVISYRKYSTKDEDKYPTFTICLWPSEGDLLGYPDILYREEIINQTLGITGSENSGSIANQWSAITVSPGDKTTSA